MIIIIIIIINFKFSDLDWSVCLPNLTTLGLSHNFFFYHAKLLLYTYIRVNLYVAIRDKILINNLNVRIFIHKNTYNYVI